MKKFILYEFKLQKGQLANPGKNHWMFDTLLGVSYLSHKTGTEFTLFAGYGISTENPGTTCRNGDIFYLESTLQQYLPLSKQTLIGGGVNGFYFQQVTGDSGSGASQFHINGNRIFEGGTRRQCKRTKERKAGESKANAGGSRYAPQRLSSGSQD